MTTMAEKVITRRSALAIAAGLYGCAKATITAPTTGTGTTTPSPLVTALDVVEVSAAAAAPWFQGAAGAWLTEVQPTAESIAADLQQASPFAQAQGYINTFQQVLTSAAAQTSLSANQLKALQSVVSAVNAFLLIYEQQAGIPTSGAAAPAAVGAGAKWKPNAADRKLLKTLAADHRK